MCNIFKSFIGLKILSIQSKLLVSAKLHGDRIQELIPEEFSAVAGAPQVDNDPEG